MPRSKAIRLLLSLATLSAPLLAPAQSAISARPGTVNYIEGQASLEGRQLSPKSVGHTELATGQYLATANGKAEVLLTPGVFLRLDNNTTIKMVTPDLTHTEVQLTQGRASVEVDQLYKQNDILIDLNHGQTQLIKPGLYEFDATANTVRVFDGEALAFASLTPQAKEKAIKVKEGKQLAFTGDAVKPVGFDRKQFESTDTLYTWGSLRSSYLGEANLHLAQSYAGSYGGGGYGGGGYGGGGYGGGGYGGGFAPGWFWSPSIYSYTWLPGDGLFFNPFGYGFYSPYYLYGGGFIYGGGYGYRGGIAHSHSTFISSRNTFRGDSSPSAGFHGGAAMSSGGFHGGGAVGGGGGFHGGGGRR